MTDFYIGVDVGTGSVRAALVTCDGHVTRVEVRDISRVSPSPGQYVQSSQEIWSAVCSCVQRLLTLEDVEPGQVKGVGFAATCSLVIETRDTCQSELCGEPGYDIIMWMDHRAKVTLCHVMTSIVHSPNSSPGRSREDQLHRSSSPGLCGGRRLS